MIFFMLLHQNRAIWRFLSTLTKFGPMLTPKGTRNPNFDPTIRTGWDQCHCKDYQIPFPRTIHGSKSELKWLRYPENHQHISRDHNFWSDHWIYNFFMFMETRHLDISRDTNISSIWVQKDLCTCIRSWTHIHTPRHILKGFGSFPYMHVYVCLLLCLMFMLASLDLGFAMLCAPLWACSYVVTSIPLVAY